MKVELFLDNRGDLRTVERQSEIAEAAGADAVVSAEGPSDALLPLMAAARSTSRVRLATGIVVAFPRSPMATALSSWNLQAYSKGRFELGLGSQVKGHNERRFSTPWSPPGPRMREYVESLRAIFACWEHKTPLEYVGKSYAFTLMPPDLCPPALGYAPIPISIAAVNPYMLNLAGELCDGVRLHSFVSRRFLDEVVRPTVERAIAKSGRDTASIDVSGGALIAIGRDESEVNRLREELRARVAFYGSTRTYSGSLDIYGWQQLAAQLHECSISNRWHLMPQLVPDEVLDEFAVVGTYDEVGKALRMRLGTFVNRLSLNVPLQSNEDADNTERLIRSLRENEAVVPDAG